MRNPMKKYLYLVCGSMLALAGCTRDADVEPARPVESGKVVLTGLSGEVTRTGFTGDKTKCIKEE